MDIATLDSLAASLDVDSTYHRPGADRLLDRLAAMPDPVPTVDAPLTCAPCGGAVLTASGRHRCVRCGRDYGAVDRAAQDEAGDRMATRERPDAFEML